MPYTKSFKIPLASYVLPQPALPIMREGCLTERNDLIKSEVAKVYMVGTVILDIIYPYVGSNSIFYNLFVHSVNLHAPPSPVIST